MYSYSAPTRRSTGVSVHKVAPASLSKQTLRLRPAGLQSLLPLTLAVFSLWMTDILINLNAFQTAIRSELSVARWLDFAGLLQAEAPIALLCMLGSLLLTGLMRLVLPSWNRADGFTAGLIAGLTFFTVLSSTAVSWNANLWWALPPAVISAGLVLVAAHRLLRRRAGRGGVAATVLLVTLTPLLFGFANQSIAGWFRETRAGTSFPIVGLLGCGVLFFLGSRARTQAARWTAAGLVPAVVLALIMAASSSVSGHDVLSEVSGDYPSRRDIVLIVLDTVRADHLALYDYERDTMPLLGEWAGGAVVVPRAVSPAGWTMPAHASMLSGRSVSQHGIHYGKETFHTKPTDGITWLPELLHEQGYTSIAVSANPLALHGDISGFDQIVVPHRYGWQGSTMAALFEKWVLVNPLSERLRWRLPYADAQSTADLVMQVVPDGDAPVFLMVNFLDAHSPYNPPRSALRRLGIHTDISISRTLGHRDLTLRWNSLPTDAARQLSDLYDGELGWMDQHLHRLLVWVEQRFGEDCVVIVTADHGEELGENGRVGHEFGLSQSLIHVPLIIRAAGLHEREIDAPVSLVRLFDFLHSIGQGDAPDLEILERPPVSAVVSERYPSLHNARLLGPTYDRSWVAMFDGPRKGLGPSSQGFELFDVLTEGFSRQVVLDASSDDGDLQARIDAYWAENADRRESSRRDEPGDEEQERLRSLGYAN